MIDIAQRLPAYAHAIMAALDAAGHRGYLVGGSLRDMLRGVTPHDYDMTTDATPQEMQEIFRDFRVIPTGLKHGTLTVLSDRQPIEVTTHRVDGEYLDSRRPESVSFTRRLEEDLSRRDFTVNAMAWHPTIGLVDLFGGCSDLEKGVIRAVGEPEKRFGEDALRILRAFRFSAQLNFEIEPRTLAGAASCREGLAHISAERIFAEISRLLEAPAAVRGLRALLDAGCEKAVFPHTVLQVNELERLEALPAQAAVRLAFLLRECTASEATELCRRWKTSNVFADQVKVLLQALAQPTPDSLYAARRYVCGYWAGWQGALAIRAALGEDVSAAMEMCKTVSKNGTAIEIKRLAVNGKELQDALGVIPARTGALLARLQDLCWQEPTRNKKPTLLALAERIVKEEGGFAE